jgi:hypothetical protein
MGAPRRARPYVTCEAMVSAMATRECFKVSMAELQPATAGSTRTAVHGVHGAVTTSGRHHCNKSGETSYMVIGLCYMSRRRRLLHAASLPATREATATWASAFPTCRCDDCYNRWRLLIQGSAVVVATRGRRHAARGGGCYMGPTTMVQGRDDGGGAREGRR